MWRLGSRRYRSEDGRECLVHVSEVENPSVKLESVPQRAVCFITPDGAWIGSAIVFHQCSSYDLSALELRVLFERATEGA